MTKKFIPLSRGITITCAAFILLLSLVLALMTYRISTASLYARYQRQAESILSYIDSFIDDDDMAECARTYTESEKYREVQELLDHFVDYYEDLHYLYILKATEPGDTVNVRSICSGNTTYEKNWLPENVVHLGDGDTDWYSEEMGRTFREIQNGTEDVFFFDPSEWGLDYTLARPLIDSTGEHYGVLCVDFSVSDIQTTIYRNTYINIALIVALGLVFTVLLVLWMRMSVTRPIRQLENRVTEFAASSHGRRDPDELVFHPLEPCPPNEIESLNRAIAKMSVDMRDYMYNAVQAEKEAAKLQTLAYQDALTKVRNKTAYERAVRELDGEIADKTAAFAIVMADLNGLKAINDRCGHDRGDEYLMATAAIICDVYAHSPVFRVGCDEFVVVLRGRDYRDRDLLLEDIRREFRESSGRADAEPWLRCSAAVGMAVYQPGDDPDADTVFRRADREMYAAKSAMKEDAPSAV